MWLIVNDLSWFWPRFSAAGRATQESVCPFHQNEYKYSHKSGAMGHLFSEWCLETHQGFKLLPELV